MSDQEQEMDQENEEEEEQQEGEEDEEQEEEGEDDEQQEEEQQDDEDEEEQDQDQEGQQEQKEQQQQQQKPVPTFKPVSQEFAFKNLLSDIASLGNSVDHFINTLPSRGGSAYRSYQPRIEPEPYRPIIIQPPVQQRKYTIMKDQDVQVSMQPQIVIQQTLTPKQQPKKQPYRISNESTKFLAQLYQENKKLKRWQNSHTGSASMTGWNKSKQKFERPEHERGLINLQDRNKQIDEAIEMLRREDNL